MVPRKNSRTSSEPCGTSMRSGARSSSKGRTRSNRLPLRLTTFASDEKAGMLAPGMSFASTTVGDVISSSSHPKMGSEG